MVEPWTPSRRCSTSVLDEVRPLERRGARRLHPRARDGRPRPARARRRRPARAGPVGRRRRGASSRSSRSRSRSCSRSRSPSAAATRCSAKVGAEPSGEPFNAISLEAGTGRPANPMVNAGRDRDDGARSRATTSRSAPGGSSRCSRRFAGRSLGVDESVYASESATGDRNRALAHLMRSYGMIDATGRASPSSRTSGSARCSSRCATSR